MNKHPAVVAAPEMLAALQPLPPDPCSGPSFAAWLNTETPLLGFLLAANLEPPEFTYRFEAGSRYTRNGGVPRLAAVTLGGLGADVDQNHQTLLEVCRQAPPAAIGGHLRIVFEWMSSMSGKPVVLERSGGSILFAPEIVQILPEARLIHLVRDGAATAISMSRHSVFRLEYVRFYLASRLGYDPYTCAHDPAQVPPALRGLLPESLSAEAFWSLPVPVSWFGSLWSHMVTVGARALMHKDHLFLRYEQLIADPVSGLQSICRYLDVDAPSGWVGDAARSVRAPSDGVEELSAREQERLRATCAPGEHVIEAYAQARSLN